MAANAGNKIRNAKLVLLGDVGTGKSSLVLRFVKGQFVEFQESTIGAAFFSQTLAVNDETVKFEIWDTAGQERYHSLAPMYYRGAAAAIVVYDITNAEAKAYAQENGLFFMETSAKTAINVNDVFYEIGIKEIASRATGPESTGRNGSQPETSRENSERFFLLLLKHRVECGQRMPWPEIRDDCVCDGNGLKLCKVAAITAAYTLVPLLLVHCYVPCKCEY
ncbi:hypothetical protein EJB05_00108 [Eragrostis curvula]|uniref:Uncharacterized protein n=1 Tax=Eragrostis curvula TaxID=38414 RepID=A0A5J9WKQ8_9POAL|nr:hypothetical protein EJB05_00108 [Eragrostis curvula]